MAGGIERQVRPHHGDHQRRSGAQRSADFLARQPRPCRQPAHGQTASAFGNRAPDALGLVDRGRGALPAESRVAGLAGGERAAAPLPLAAHGHARAELARRPLQPRHAVAARAVAVAQGIPRAVRGPETSAPAARAGRTAPAARPGDDSQHARQRRIETAAAPRGNRVVRAGRRGARVLGAMGNGFSRAAVTTEREPGQLVGAAVVAGGGQQSGGVAQRAGKISRSPRGQNLARASALGGELETEVRIADAPRQSRRGRRDLHPVFANAGRPGGISAERRRGGVRHQRLNATARTPADHGTIP